PRTLSIFIDHAFCAGVSITNQLVTNRRVYEDRCDRNRHRSRASVGCFVVVSVVLERQCCRLARRYLSGLCHWIERPAENVLVLPVAAGRPGESDESSSVAQSQ